MQHRASIESTSSILVASTLLAIAAVPRVARAAPLVWAVDDGDKIKRDAVDTPRSRGVDNPVWSPGAPVRLFAIRNETVAFQVIVQADADPLSGVTVDLDELVGPNGAIIRNAPSATDPASFVGRPIERFVEHYFDILRPSGNESSPSESLGWSSGSAPASGAFTGPVPDALIPIEIAPSWDPYPMSIAPNSNGAVWIDVMTASDQTAGIYRGNVVVRAQTAELATLPIELTVEAATLPDRPALPTMLYYSPGELNRRIGGGAAVERYLWQLFHRHRLSAMHSAKTTTDLDRQMGGLDGSAFTTAAGYDGPGMGLGDGILSLGTYGTYGDPSSSTLASVEAIADELAAKHLLDTTDVFVYAIDENCGSDRGAAWKDLLARSTDSNVKKIKVGWTCSRNPASQPVDLPIVFASSFDPAAAADAAAAGKTVWVYNGSFPETGTFLTDVEAVSTRMNGWLGARFGMGRWFYWETTFWYDDNRGGKGAYDPFVTAETFHNSSGDYCEGDGVLVYPGRQVDRFTDHSLGFDGVIASIRLKNLRRGIEDAGYYQLAHAVAPAEAEAIVSALLPNVLTTAKRGDPIAAPDVGKKFFDARRALLDRIPKDAPVGDAGGGTATSGGRGADAGATSAGGVGTGGASTGGAGAGDARTTGDAGIPEDAAPDSSRGSASTGSSHDGGLALDGADGALETGAGAEGASGASTSSHADTGVGLDSAGCALAGGRTRTRTPLPLTLTSVLFGWGLTRIRRRRARTGAA